jgi:CBS domain-containing protein
MEITVETIMVRDVITIGKNETVADAAKAMSENNIGAIVVVEDGSPEGIVTERDFVKRMAAKGGMEMRIGEIMSSPVVSVPQDTPIPDALELMAKKRIRRLPVVEDGRLVGVVTSRDLFPRYIDSLLESFNKIYEILESIR